MRGFRRGQSRDSCWLSKQKPVSELKQCIHRLTVNLAVGQERGCVSSTSRSRFGVRASHRYYSDWLSAESRSTDNLWMNRTQEQFC